VVCGGGRGGPLPVGAASRCWGTGSYQPLVKTQLAGREPL
jgi:hypothetical protein